MRGLGLCILAWALSCAAQEPLEGTWVGQWVRNGSVVDLTMRFTRAASGYEGSFDSEGLPRMTTSALAITQRAADAAARPAWRGEST